MFVGWTPIPSAQYQVCILSWGLFLRFTCLCDGGVQGGDKNGHLCHRKVCLKSLKVNSVFKCQIELQCKVKSGKLFFYVFVLRMPGRGGLDYIFHVHNPRTLSARPEGMMFVFLSFLRHQSAGIVDLTFHSFRYSCREAHSKMNDFFRSTSLNKYLTVCRKLSQTVWTGIVSPRRERDRVVWVK